LSPPPGTRKYALWLLNHADEVLAPPVALRRQYGPEVEYALVLAWETLKQPLFAGVPRFVYPLPRIRFWQSCAGILQWAVHNSSEPTF